MCKYLDLNKFWMCGTWRYTEKVNAYNVLIGGFLLRFVGNGVFNADTALQRVPGSVVGIATAYGLDGPGIESWRGARFSAPVQTGPEAHSASCTMGTGSFPG